MTNLWICQFFYLPLQHNQKQITMELKEALSHCMDESEYPDVFLDTCGLGIFRPEKKLHSVPSWRRGKRKVTLKISSFRGISGGAIHYYGEIQVDGVEMEFDGEVGHTTSDGREKDPLCDWIYKVKIIRNLTEEEVEADPQRWQYKEAGDWTNCFETMEEIVDLFEEISKVRFAGDWAFKVEVYYSNTIRSIEDFKKYLKK